MGIKKDTQDLLQRLGTLDQEVQKGKLNKLEGQLLERLMYCWDSNRLNNAVDMLEKEDAVKVIRRHGTAPYSFDHVALTPSGRLALEEAEQDQQVEPGHGHSSNIRNVVSVQGTGNQVSVGSNHVKMISAKIENKEKEQDLLWAFVAALLQEGHDDKAEVVKRLAYDLEKNDVSPSDVVKVLEESMKAVPTLRERLSDFLVAIGGSASGSLLARAAELLLDI